MTYASLHKSLIMACKNLEVNQYMWGIFHLKKREVEMGGSLTTVVNFKKILKDLPE